MTDAYDIVTFRGKRFDRMTAQALSQMEEKLGYQLSIMQGSYNSGVGASAGTHDRGGAVDLAPADWQRKVKVGRQIGFAMWHRLPSEGPWSAHCHGILIGNTHVSSGARNQVISYRNGRNGLANGRRDTFWRPSPIPTYKYRQDVAKSIGVSLHALRVDFAHAIDGGKNKPRYSVKRVQRLLNKKLGTHLKDDGIVGKATVAAWVKYEKKTGVSGVSNLPDNTTLKRLFKWTPYFVKK